MGTATTSRRISISTRTLTNWPGHSDVGRVVEHRLEIDRRGVRIDLVVDDGELADGESLAVAVLGRHLDVALSPWPPRIAGRESAGSGKVTKIGSSWLMMTMPPVSVAFTMLPASISRVPARPFKRRADAAVVELDLGAVDRGLVGLDARLELLHQGARRVQLLGADCAGRGEAGEAVQVEARVFEQRLVPELVRLRLVERRLVGLRIDFDQHVAGADVLAFGEIDLLDLAVDPRLDEHAVQGLHGPEAGEEDRNVGAAHLALRSREWRRAVRGATPARPAEERKPRHDDIGQESRRRGAQAL